MATLTLDGRTADDRRVLIIDEAIPEDMAQDLFELAENSPGWGYGAPGFQNDSDQVPFIHGFEVEELLGSPLWECLQAHVREHLGEGYQPYDVSINHLRFGDNPVEHRDNNNPDVSHMTLLLYLNPDWHRDYSGESVVYGEDGEVEYAVMPRFQRLAMWDGATMHSARAPTPAFSGVRYTLAIKIAKQSPDQARQESYAHGDESEHDASTTRARELRRTLFDFPPQTGWLEQLARKKAERDARKRQREDGGDDA